MKTFIEVDGQKVEIDLENLSKEEAEKYNIHINTDDYTDNVENHSFHFSFKDRSIKKKITSVIFLISLMAFFLCGFLLHGWGWSWTLLLINPVLNILLNLSNKPFKKAIESLVTLVVIGIMLYIGIVHGGWYWCWVLIFIIPIFNIILE